MSERTLLRIRTARRRVWKAAEDREGGEGRIGCNLSSCEQLCGMGIFLFAAAGGLALSGWRKGVPSSGREQPGHRSPENLLTIFGCRENIKAENVQGVVLNPVVLLVWMKK